MPSTGWGYKRNNSGAKGRKLPESTKERITFAANNSRGVEGYTRKRRRNRGKGRYMPEDEFASIRDGARSRQHDLEVKSSDISRYRDRRGDGRKTHDYRREEHFHNESDEKGSRSYRHFRSRDIEERGRKRERDRDEEKDRRGGREEKHRSSRYSHLSSRRHRRRDGSSENANRIPRDADERRRPDECKGREDYRYSSSHRHHHHRRRRSRSSSSSLSSPSERQERRRRSGNSRSSSSASSQGHRHHSHHHKVSSSRDYDSKSRQYRKSLLDRGAERTERHPKDATRGERHRDRHHPAKPALSSDVNATQPMTHKGGEDRPNPLALRRVPPPAPHYIFCHICGQRHWTVQCERLLSHPEKYPLMTPRGCWKCGRTGHNSHFCRTPAYRCKDCGGVHSTPTCAFDVPSMQWHEFYCPTRDRLFYSNSDESFKTWDAPLLNPQDELLWYCPKCCLMIPHKYQECLNCQYPRPQPTPLTQLSSYETSTGDVDMARCLAETDKKNSYDALSSISSSYSSVSSSRSSSVSASRSTTREAANEDNPA